jgi:hypothetical protein
MFYPIVISLLILAHVLADFVCQPDEVATNKGESPWHMCKHISWHLFFSLALTVLYWNVSLTIIIIVIALIHWAVDYLKENHTKQYNEFTMLLCDQLIHVIVMMLFATIFLKEINLNSAGAVVINWLTSTFPNCSKITTNDWIVYILGAALYIFNVRGASIFVEKLTKQFEPKARRLEIDLNTREFTSLGMPPDKKQIKELLKFSAETIGKLERILIVTFVLFKAYDAIGAVLTAKSVARFKEFDNPQYAEYFIVGTLASTVIAVLTSSLVNTLR